LLNLGDGQFLDATEGVGLAGLGNLDLYEARLADIDNDGDLDLMTGDPTFLFLNNGDGRFTETSENTGLDQDGFWALSFGDYDGDGFLDLFTGTALYRNQGNDNHWLRVELVGTESNRNGIGAQLTATAGDLRQIREIYGGMGFSQDEGVAHFGLGQRTQVERLEIRWPSGQVDELEDIPADQKIRVFEGQAVPA
jgi:hypothetical protein